MKNASNVINLGLATIGLFVSAIAFASPYVDDVAPARSIEACVAEIGARADYDGANHVRHEVTRSERRSLAYRFSIGTQVLNDDNGEVIREYETKCVVYGSDKPAYFEIEETKSSS